MPNRSPGHLQTFGYVGLYRYALTFSCHNKERRFERASAVDLVLSQIRRAADEERFAVSAYCFMPDHLHLLVEARDTTSNGLKFIKRAKQFSGFYYKQKYHEPLWQRYCYEHVLRDADDMRRGSVHLRESCSCIAGRVATELPIPGIRYSFCVGTTRFHLNETSSGASQRPAEAGRYESMATKVWVHGANCIRSSRPPLRRS
jgi:putative transposase